MRFPLAITPFSCYNYSMKNPFEKIFDEFDLYGKTVAVAVSGGKDSVCLLDVLTNCSERLNVKVKAINVEHGIRGEASLKDSEFVKNLCDRLNVELFFKRVNAIEFSKSTGMSVEESARALRYGVFNEAIESGFCDVIATAHHLSDSAETILFNILRGASLGGVGGIDKISHGGKIIRPFLNVKREEIDEYVKEKNLNFVTDETNFDDVYTRNFLRLNVIPLIKEKFPKAEEALLRFSEISAKENAYLEAEAAKALEVNGNEVYIKADTQEVIFARAAVLALKRLGVVKDYEKRHIDGLMALRNAKSGTKISMPKGIKAVKDYDKIAFYTEREIAEVFMPFKVGKAVIGDSVVVVERSDGFKREKSVNYFDGDKIPKDAVIRKRADGDVFEKFGGGTKKLKDYLIDKKIPARKRDELLVLADGKNVLLIVGIEISERIKVDKSTVNVLKCYKETI